MIDFIRQSFPAWMIDPLQTQFTDNLFNAGGEVRHLPYGEGTLRIGPLVEAAVEAGLPMVVISEAREQSSHDAIQKELTETLVSRRPEEDRAGDRSTPGAIQFPDRLTVQKSGPAFQLSGPRPLKLSNLDKQFFPDGYTKGDLIQYYASVAPVLLPHICRSADFDVSIPRRSRRPLLLREASPGPSAGLDDRRLRSSRTRWEGASASC